MVHYTKEIWEDGKRRHRRIEYQNGSIHIQDPAFFGYIHKYTCRVFHKDVLRFESKADGVHENDFEKQYKKMFLRVAILARLAKSADGTIPRDEEEEEEMGEETVLQEKLRVAEHELEKWMACDSAYHEDDQEEARQNVEKIKEELKFQKTLSVIVSWNDDATPNTIDCIVYNQQIYEGEYVYDWDIENGSCKLTGKSVDDFVGAFADLHYLFPALLNEMKAPIEVEC